MNLASVAPEIRGQLNSEERHLLTDAVVNAIKKPKVVVEVGTWLGGGSTLHLLRALQRNEEGRLWGIEVDPAIYSQMLENIQQAAPEAAHRFTPMFGLSQDVLKRWLGSQMDLIVDLVFLDGGNNPGEQIAELKLLDPHISVGGQLFAHDAKMRKGKWLVPYLSHLDNWQVQVHDVSEVGLLQARKTSPQPSASSRRKAATCLLKLRLSPIEVAAAFLPPRFCGLVLGLLPKKIARRLSDGC